LFHFAILLPDRPSLGRLVTHLNEIGAYAGMSDHLVSEAIYLTDPDGLGIEVYADRPRAEWRYEGRELVMSTLPLDVPNLVAAAGNTRWSGMPNGTRMGHIHLHVGDLDAGAAFYHDALGSTRSSGATRVRCSCPPAATITISVRTRGPRVRRRRVRMTRA
jgi:catechol 2,3-dioxygenase